MMKIKMIETRRGTEDGFTVNQYISGEEYEVRDHLGLAFMAAGNAEPVFQSEKKRKDADN